MAVVEAHELWDGRDGSETIKRQRTYTRTFQVRVQADQAFRLEPEDIRQLQVRDEQGRMVPLGALVKVERRLGPQLIQRYNKYPTASITGNPSNPRSSAVEAGSTSAGPPLLAAQNSADSNENAAPG